MVNRILVIFLTYPRTNLSSKINPSIQHSNSDDQSVQDGVDENPLHPHHPKPALTVNYKCDVPCVLTGKCGEKMQNT